LVRRRLERPVDEQRTANYIFARNEAPEPTVKADIAVVTHGKVTVRWHHDVVSLNILMHRHLPLRGGRGIAILGRKRRELNAIRIVVAHFMSDVRFIKTLPVAVDYSTET